MGKSNLRTKTKSKNKKRQTCATGVHVDDRSVNSRPNSEGVNKTVNTPGVKRDFSAYASPKIHFISSTAANLPTWSQSYPRPTASASLPSSISNRTASTTSPPPSPRPSTERSKLPTPALSTTAAKKHDCPASTPFPPCGGSATDDSPTPRQGGGLTHAPLRAWDPKRATQQTEGTPPASGKGAFDVGCRVGGNSPHLRAVCLCRSPCP